MVSKYEICRMKILVVAATEMEIEPFIRANTDIETLICGVGIPSTVFHLTKKLLAEKYDIVIQAGIAGTFSKQVKKGEVISVGQDTFADIGVEENKQFKTVFELGFVDKNEFPFSYGWLTNESDIFKTLPFICGVGITVNKVSDKKKLSKQLYKKFNADIETMEGAAFHYVCLQQGIPFLQIRSVSNKVGERDKTKWRIKEAVENLNVELIKLVALIK